MPPRMLADAIDVPYAELEPLLGERYLLAEIDRDEVWWKIAEYTSVRIGQLMAIRHELDQSLQQDRAKRAVRIVQQRKLPGRPPPRRLSRS